MNCGKSWFVDADHTCPRANKIVCRSSYKKQKLSHALHRCSSRKGYHQTKKQSGYQHCYVFASKMTGLDADIVRASLRIAIDNINQNR